MRSCGSTGQIKSGLGFIINTTLRARTGHVLSVTAVALLNSVAYLDVHASVPSKAALDRGMCATRVLRGGK